MEDRQQAEFNMAVSYLSRLNLWFMVAGEAALGLDVFNWFHALMVIMRELSTEIKEEEMALLDAMIDEINPMVEKAYKDFTKSGVRQIDNLLHKKLHRFELLLRKVLKESGLQMRMQEDAKFALK